MKKYVVGFIFDPGMKHVLLLERVKNPYKGLWNGIGGKVEEDEIPTQAMEREFLEETGMKLIACHPFKKLVTLVLDDIELTAFYAVTKETPSLFEVMFTREGTLEWFHIEMNALLQSNNPILAGEGNISYFLHLAQLIERRG